MKHLFFAILFFSSPALAKPTSLLDVNVGFGSYTLELKYIFKGTKVPYDGYLLRTNDIALLKVDLDSYKDDCESIVEEASTQCINDLQSCAADCDSRVDLCTQETYFLLKEVDSYEDKLKVQKGKTVIYSLISGLSAVTLTSLYFVLR